MLDQIIPIAREAGRRIMSFYDRDMGVSYKEDESPLTLADRAGHEYIVESLRTAFPDIPVISEEGYQPPYEERKYFKYFFLVDPLDGTKEFIKRNDEFTVNIALIEKDHVNLGVVGIPVREQVYGAARGHGAYFWDKHNVKSPRLAARQGFNPDKIVAAVSRSHPSGKLNEFIQNIPGMEPKAVGSSLKFCFLADDQIDCYPRFGPLMEWDTAAAHIVAEEAGAILMGLDGNPITYNKPILKHEHGFIAAANRDMYEWLLKRVEEIS